MKVADAALDAALGNAEFERLEVLENLVFAARLVAQQLCQRGQAQGLALVGFSKRVRPNLAVSYA